jgi:hypothetical protein
MPRHLVIGVLIGLLFSAGGCAGPGLVVRSDRGQAVQLDLSRVCPVEYQKDDLQVAMGLFVEHLAGVIQQRGSQLRVRLASTDARVEAYLRWCSRRGTPGDCLGLLDARTPGLTVDAMHTIAVRVALAYGLQEAAEVVRTIDPVKVEALMIIWFTVYLVSLVAPDVTVTKALNVLMTANMIAFLGWDGFRNIIQGYRDMSKEVDVAQTFEEVQAAGERYGRRMGASMVRIVTALATWGLSASTGLVRPVTELPGGAQAVANAQAQGFRLLAVTGGSVSVTATGTVTLVLAAEATIPEGGGGANAPAKAQTSKPEQPATAKETPSIRSRLRDAGLPGGSESTQIGPFRYRPPEDYLPGNPLPKADGGGYFDRFRNIWKKGPYHGDPSKPFTFEWDVQLSDAGRQYFRELGLGEKGYVNVAPDGTLSH